MVTNSIRVRHRVCVSEDVGLLIGVDCEIYKSVETSLY